MLNQEKGGNRILVKMTLKILDIKNCVYSNMKSEITGMDLPKSDEPDHKIFIINGKYDLMV